MRNDADTLDITGTATFGAEAGVGYISAGLIRHFGLSFTAGDGGFEPSGGTILFNRLTRQDVTLSGSSNFAHVVVAHTGGVNPGYLYGVVMNLPTGITMESLLQQSGQLNVMSSTVIRGDLRMQSGTLITRAGNLSYGGTFVNNGGALSGGTPTEF